VETRLNEGGCADIGQSGTAHRGQARRPSLFQIPASPRGKDYPQEGHYWCDVCAFICLICVYLHAPCLSACLSACAMSISMRHVYLYAPCVCVCAMCMCKCMCMLHACGMCFTAPSLCQDEASLSAHDTSVASALEGEMASHEMSATCQLMRWLLMPSKVRWLLIRWLLMPRRHLKPQTSNLKPQNPFCTAFLRSGKMSRS